MENNNGTGGRNGMKIVYTIVERAPGKSYWTRVGVGFVNKDGSLNLRLDAIPTNGTLQVRDWEPQEERGGDGALGRRQAPPPALNGDIAF